MAILKKSVALLLTVLLAFSSWSVLASAEWDPDVQPNNLSLEVQLYRNAGTESAPNWVEVSGTKVAPGEKVKARVFVGTDYSTYGGSLLLFYDSDFFTSSYNATPRNLVVNPDPASTAQTYQITAEAVGGNGGDRALASGFITQSFHDTHGDVMISYYCDASTMHQALNEDAWLVELDLVVRSDVQAMSPDGSVFFVESTIRTPDRQRGIINVPNADPATVGEVNCSGMQLWSADVTIVNNDVIDNTTDGNCGSINNTISFDANGGSFAALTNPQVKTGIIGTQLNFTNSVVEPTRAEFSFIGWYPADFVGTPTESDCVASDNFDYTALTYKALWRTADVELTFDANGGKFSDNTTAKTVDAASGVAIAFPAEPTNPGYNFAGWATQGGSVIGEGTLAPTANTTYYAQWTPVGTPFKITLNYHNVITDNDVTYTVNGNGATGDTVRIVESIPATPAANSVYYTYAQLAANVANYELDTTDSRNEFTEQILGNGTTELNLYFKAVNYTATFDANSGKFSNNQAEYETTQQFYSYITGPAANPTRTGYNFNGWNPTFTQGTTRMLDSRTFTAQWAPKTYNAVFMVGSTVYFTQPTQFGSNIVVPPVPSGSALPEGYTFGGWNPTTTGGVVMDTEGKTFNAILNPVNVTVTFDANGGEFADATTQKTVSGSFGGAIATPETPTNGTATFAGWYTIGNVQFEAGVTTIPASNTTYYARWQGATTHNATFNANGGAFADAATSKTVSYTENAFVGNPGDPVRADFTFLGWFDASDVKYVAGTTKMGTSDITFTAKWAKNVTVTYNANGTEFAKYNTYEGAAIPEPADEPSKTGNTFTGWLLTEGTVSGTDPIVPAMNLVYEAQFTPINYKVTYEYTGTIPADAPALPAEKTDAHYQDTISVATAPSLGAYVFSGWTCADVDVTGATFLMPAKDITISGSWSLAPTDKLTVTYHTASGSVFTTQLYDEGDDIIPPANSPTAQGMTFSSWTTDPNAATPPALPANMPATGFDAYPVWNLNKYSVTYNVDGAQFASYPEVTFGSEVPVPTDPSKDEYIFAGWSPTVPATMPDNALVFTALWTPVPGPGEYTVTYYSAFNKTFAAFTAHEGEAVPTPDTDPTLFGHTFTGWTPAVPDTMPAGNLEFNAQWKVDDTFVAVVVGGTVVAGGVIAAAAAVTTGITIAAVGGAIIIGLIASADSYTVTYVVDGETYKTYKVLAGTKIPVPSDPSKDGYTFSEWTPEIPDRMPKNDLTFEAKWSKGGTASVDDEIPQTGSATGSVTAFVLLSTAAACAYLFTKKKREEF